jgi:hypothetical protein
VIGQESTVVVFTLYHIRTKENGDDDEKLIGIYTTEGKAKAAIQRLSGQPGFRDYPDGFQNLRCSLG